MLCIHRFSSKPQIGTGLRRHDDPGDGFSESAGLLPSVREGSISPRKLYATFAQCQDACV